MTKREMTASEMGRKGGSVTGASKRRGDSDHYAALASLRWADMTSEERSAEMSRRRRKGRK
jgi:hypothetical protein